MRDKVLAYALAVSVGVHIVILGMVGRTSAARPIDLDELKVVRVEMVKLPDFSTPVSATKPSPIEQEHASVPPPERIPVAPLPKPRPAKRLPNGPIKTASNKLPGNPGGPLDMGAPSPRGENLGPSGQTPVGWVPNPNEGAGVGSGKGEGVGKPEPVPGAVEGTRKEPSPLPPPAVVEAPKHVSTLADRSVPELISGRKSPKYPESAKDRGIEGAVTIEYMINTDGNVVGAKVASSSGSSDLDKAAISTVESRKYKPAVQAGIPRNYRKRETFRFALD